MSRRTRRQWIAGVVGAGIAGIAGCTSPVNDASDRSETGSTAEPPQSDPSTARPTDDGGQMDMTATSTEPTTDARPVADTVAKLVSDDATDGDGFGIDVAIDGDVALVGAHRDSTARGEHTGAAYLFTRSNGGWRQTTKLTPADGTRGGGFGFAVDLADGLAVVGAPGHDTENGSQAGSADVFARQDGTWRRQARLVPDDGGSEDWFGSSVVLRGDGAVVGAKGADVAGESNAGAAYVFRRTDGEWHHRSKLTAADGDAEDRFGTAVSLEGDTALVGAPDDDPNGRLAGSAYVFERAETEWSQTAKLYAGDDPGMGAFGHAVSVDGDRALIGAFLEDEPNGEGSGAAYAFARENGGWSRTEKIAPASGDGVEAFGIDIAMTDRTAVVGASDAAVENDIETGAAVVYARSDGGWTRQRRLLPDDLRRGALFGTSVALSEGTILVGSPADDAVDRFSPGAAYVFER